MQNTPKSTSQNISQSPLSTPQNPATQDFVPFFAISVLCALAEIHTALGELEEAEIIYKTILHSDYLLNLLRDFGRDIFLPNGAINFNNMRPIENFWRLYEKQSETKSLNIFYEILDRAKSILATLKSSNKQIEYISPNAFLPDNQQPLAERISNIPKTIGQYDSKITQLQSYIDCMLRPGIAFYLFSLYKDKESINLYEELESKNTHNADFWCFYGMTLWYNKNYQKAYDSFQMANAIAKQDSNALFACGKMLLQLLESEEMYFEGLALYEHRLPLSNRGDIVFSKPHYNALINDFNADKAVLAGKAVFVVSEQGYGDTLMFCVALAKLCKIAKKVFFMPQTGLFRLFDSALKSIRANEPNGVFANLHIIGSLPRDKKVENAKIEPRLLEFQKECAKLSYDFDYAVPICSLPFFTHLNLQEWLSLPRPLLRINHKSQSATNPPKIAIFWHTNSSGNYERFSRDIPLEIITNAFVNSPYQLVSFQVREKIQGKLEDFVVPSHIENRGENLKDWQDTYENLSDIDMIISIDSAFAHLGLVVGIPTLVLLPLRFDWRWGRLENPKSPFYPHAHLVVFDSNQHDSKMLKRNKATSQKIRKIADEVLNR